MEVKVIFKLQSYYKLNCGKKLMLTIVFVCLVLSPLQTYAHTFTFDDRWDEPDNEWDYNQSSGSNISIDDEYPYFLFDNDYHLVSPSSIMVNTSPWLVTMELPPRREGLDIHGVMPLLTAEFGSSYVEVNKRINDITDFFIGEARRVRARSVTFSHESIITEDMVSIVIYASVSSVISRNLVRSINFCPYTGDFLTIFDATDVDIVSLAGRVLTERMRRSPEDYYAVQSIVFENQAFFVSNLGLTILFDEFQLSSMVSGNYRLELTSRSVRTANINADQSRPSEDNNYDLVMVPLRIIAEQLGFYVHWDTFALRVELWNGDPESETSQILAWLYPGINLYSTQDNIHRALEAPPFLVNGTTYVPITFFEQILTNSVYSKDAYGNITILAYLG